MKRLIWLVTVLFAVGVGVWLGRLDRSQIGAAFIAAAVEDRSLALGAAAPPFDLPGVDDRRYTLADFDSAAVLAVVFTCNHCPTAQAYEPRIMELASSYPATELAVVAISTNDPQAVALDELGYSDLNDSLDEMKIRARDRGFSFPYLYDGDAQTVGQAYGPLATPHVFVFDRERRLRYKGRFDNAEDPRHVKTQDTRNAIDALLAGRAPAVSATRVFGCSIKWSDKREDVAAKHAAWTREPVSVQPLAAADVRPQVLENGTAWQLVSVWATWCTPCKDEFPHLVAMQRMYGGRGLEVVTISLDGAEQGQAVQDFLASHHALSRNYHFTSADQDALATALDPGWQGGVPYTVLLAPGGTVAARWHGQFEPLAVRRAIVERLGRTYF